LFVRHERTDRHRHRPPHPTRGIPPAARRGQRELPARIGREGSAGSALVRRLRLADRGCRRGGGLRAPCRRLPRLRPRRATRADRATPRRGSRPAREPFRRGRDARALRPRPRDGGGAVRRPGRRRGAARWAAALARPAVAVARRLDPSASLAARVRAFGRAGERAHPRGRRLPDSPLAARRTTDLCQRARALSLVAPREPVPVPLPARARRPRSRRLLAGNAGQGRGPGRGRATATPSGCSRRRRTAPST